MIPIILLDELADFLKEANKTFVPSDERIKNNELNVMPGYLKRREKANEKLFPYIVPRLIKGEDADDGSAVTVRIYFATYCEDVLNAWRELYNLMEHSRQALLKQRTLANKFRLKLPISYEMLEDQPYPEWLGWMDVQYEIFQPQEEEFIDGFEHFK